jgi:hypothetical protein
MARKYRKNEIVVLVRSNIELMEKQSQSNKGENI